MAARDGWSRTTTAPGELVAEPTDEPPDPAPEADQPPEALFPDLPGSIEARIDAILNRPGAEWEAAFGALAEQFPDHRPAILGLYEMFAQGPSLAALEPDDHTQGKAAQRRADGLIGQSIGRCSILKLLGEGGMGEVYLAEQTEPVRRRVALKVIKAGMDSARVLSRFALERQALAVMSHENIAKVYDAGTTDLGQPYFVMEYVPGLPLGRHCDRFQYSIERRLELFVRVCAGVQHAHHKGIIHRDLKPANILVSTAQDRPTPKIIDFGLARATGESIGGSDHQTRIGFTLGTPEYMSPEQAGAGPDVDTRADVYSLGVILFELLVGTLPFPSAELRSRSLTEIQQFLETADAPRPSSCVPPDTGSSEALVVRSTNAEALRSKLRRDLDWIVLKAMAVERSRRYSTPAELAADIQRYLRHEPVLATPPTTWYRVTKYWQRHKIQVSAALLVALALVGGATGTALGLIEAREANRETSKALRQAENYLDQLGLLKIGESLAAARNDPAVDVVPWPQNLAQIEAWVDNGETVAAKHEVVLAALGDLTARAAAAARAGATAKYDWNDEYLTRRLTELDAELLDFCSGIDSLLERMRARARWAATVTDLSITSNREAWDEAIAAIAASDGVRASEAYGHMTLEPQVGLVPLRMDPRSKLWEFLHLRSGDHAPPRLDEQGRYRLINDTGIVFILVPGGATVLGASADDARHPDLAATDQDGPSYGVHLEPYFLAKYELSQGQWWELGGGKPASLHDGMESEDGKAFTWLNPVEQVSWFDCKRVLGGYGLRMPTEQEWEHACRAGTPTPWSCGATTADLDGYANLADRRAAEFTVWESEAFDDGYVAHAPIGSFLPNPFGFHDMHGNVSEWCEDVYAELLSQPQSSERVLDDSGVRVVRGGAFFSIAAEARSSSRLKYDPGGKFQFIGVRPARSITP